ncbi:MetQ/NlpA family ABC transporter substrate-binding protein [Sporolactobacillus shoreicorticis]|uniref:ABC transporter substrate-binding protein n=1 Tax=Sporolactobacillus shoreicorticis TaxID=1923877 RepID=A0ABW5S5J2_9BACL|nr:ABC transporter substrate-binding protein [Sporolactobacillus shoreicorticis]MCO7124407.1 MetQ/NlpA family ABC transporter substrate-binding protein [Sporolactobacillus shoreicorticis]
MKGYRTLITAGIILILTGALFGCSGQNGDTSKATGSSASDPITKNPYPKSINVGVIEGGPESAILVKENFLKNFGVKVKVISYSAGTDINNAFVSRKVDLASFGSYPIALGIANSIDYKAVYVPYVEGGNIEALVAKKKQKINSLVDLKGKKIATPFGTTSQYALLNTLKLAGLDAKKDVKLLDMGGQDIVAAWTRGDIDAAYIWSPALDQAVEKGGKIIANDGDLVKKGVTIPEIAVASGEFAKNYPTLVQKYVQALVKVSNLVKEDPERATQDVAKWENVTEANAKGQITDNIWASPQDQLSNQYLGKSGKGKLAETLKTIADFHKEQGDISQSPDVSTFESAIDSTYIEKVLKK